MLKVKQAADFCTFKFLSPFTELQFRDNLMLFCAGRTHNQALNVSPDTDGNVELCLKATIISLCYEGHNPPLDYFFSLSGSS